MPNQTCWFCEQLFLNDNLPTHLDIDKVTLLVKCSHCGTDNILRPQPCLCFYCHKDLGVAEDFIGDINCPSCNVQNTIFPFNNEVSNIDEDKINQTTENKWLKKEENMPFEKRENNYLSLPKVGQEYDFSQHGKIVEIKKVEGNKKGFNFVKRETLTLPDGTTATVDKDLGYRYTIQFEDGKVLTVSSWKPYYAMEEAGLIEGVKFQLRHLVKGEWECILI